MTAAGHQAKLRLGAALLSTGLLALPSTAVAAGNAAAAESLFREGRTLMEKGDFVAACPKLAESNAQEPATGTLVALARCYQKAGKLATAWVTYDEALARAKREGRTDREQAVREQLALIEPKLSYLTIEVTPEVANLEGLTVKLDGGALGRAGWGVSTPVDSGEHSVEATAPGKTPFAAKVSIVTDANKQKVRIDALEDASTAAAVAPQNAVDVSSSDVAESAGGMPPLRLAGLIVGGVGVVGLGLSGYFGLHAASLNSDSKDLGCNGDNRCPPNGLEKRNDAVDSSRLATITLIGGGVLAAAGATLFIVGGKSSERGQASVSATPVVGWNTAGIVVRGSL